MTNHQMQIIAEEFKIMKRAKFAEKYGLKTSTLTSRITLKPDLHISQLLYPVGASKNGIDPHKYEWQGKLYTMQELAGISGLSKSCLRQRIKRTDKSIDEIMSENKAARLIRQGVRKKRFDTEKEKTNSYISTLKPLTEMESKLAQMQEWRANGATDDQIKFRLRSI